MSVRDSLEAMLCLIIGLLVTGVAIGVFVLLLVMGGHGEFIKPLMCIGMGLPMIVLGWRLYEGEAEDD